MENMGENRIQKLSIVRRLIGFYELEAFPFIRRPCVEERKQARRLGGDCNTQTHGRSGTGWEVRGWGGEAHALRPGLRTLQWGLTSSGGFFTFCMYLRTTSSGFLPARTQRGVLEGAQSLPLRAWLRMGSGVRVGLAGVTCQRLLQSELVAEGIRGKGAETRRWRWSSKS